MTNVLSWLESSAERMPEKCAFAEPGCSLSYKNLLERSRAFGSWIAERSPAREGVALFLDKGVNTVAAMMGAVYAGDFYSVIDVRQTPSRIASIVEEIRPRVLISDAAHSDLLHKALPDQSSFEFALIDDIASTPIDEPLLAQRRASACDIDPLYVNFTSGSTGTPKGVVVSHRSVIDFIPEFCRVFGMTEDDVFANQAPFDFDVSVKDLYSSLYLGATVHILPRDYFMDPTALMDYLDESRASTLVWAVSAMCFVSIMNGFEYKIPHSVRQVLFSGEIMPPKQLRIWQEALPDARFINVYGPTEITCNCTYHVVDRPYADDEPIPIGRAFANERVFLLDDKDELVENPGVTGEICVGGTTLGIGYLNNLSRSAETFVQNPLNARWIEPIYRTGDLARYNDQGELVYQSRKDFQIKHMGQRIELGDIEATAMTVTSVSRACCLYDERRKRIRLFYVGHCEKDELLSELREKLPQYMVPNVIRKLDQMPLTKNGKIDRAKLAQS